MAVKTERDVIEKALMRLNIIAVGEEIDADLLAEAQDEYRVMHEWMRQEFRRGLWGRDAVDERYWTHVAGMLAGRLADVLPVSDTRYQKAMAGAAKSENYLREQMDRRTIDAVEIAYF